MTGEGFDFSGMIRRRMVREEGSDRAAVIRDDWVKQVMWDKGRAFPEAQAECARVLWQLEV